VHSCALGRGTPHGVAVGRADVGLRQRPLWRVSAGRFFWTSSHFFPCNFQTRFWACSRDFRPHHVCGGISLWWALKFPSFWCIEVPGSEQRLGVIFDLAVPEKGGQPSSSTIFHPGMVWSRAQGSALEGGCWEYRWQAHRLCTLARRAPLAALAPLVLSLLDTVYTHDKASTAPRLSG
jgi:hypothetical protein